MSASGGINKLQGKTGIGDCRWEKIAQQKTFRDLPRSSALHRRPPAPCQAFSADDARVIFSSRRKLRNNLRTQNAKSGQGNVMNVLVLCIQLLSGAAAGNIMCSACPNVHFGTVGNSVIGMIGGFAAAQALFYLCGAQDSATDMQIVSCSIAGGAAGGFVLTGFLGIIKGSFRHKR